MGFPYQKRCGIVLIIYVTDLPTKKAQARTLTRLFEAFKDRWWHCDHAAPPPQGSLKGFSLI